MYPAAAHPATVPFGFCMLFVAAPRAATVWFGQSKLADNGLFLVGRLVYVSALNVKFKGFEIQGGHLEAVWKHFGNISGMSWKHFENIWEPCGFV